jgi:hypothetical protein
MKGALSITVFVLFCVMVILRGGHTQNCLNQAGEPVSWWVILKVPPTIGNSGYGFYDSNTKTGQFVYVNKTVDLDVSHLTQTLGLINRDKL